MKLGILCTMINGFGRRGYYNTQEIGLGRALVRQGHTVVIYKCLKREGKAEVQQEKVEPGLIIYYLPIGGLGAHGFLPARVLSKELDGILCFSDNQVFLPHIFRFCRKNGIGFVPYVGTTFSLHCGFHAWVMNTWFALGTRRIYRKYPVIAKTEGAAGELKALGAGDVTVAPVGLDTAVLKVNYRACDREELRAEYGFDRDDVILCDVARLEPEKRPLDMLDVFCRIRGKKPFKLLFVGEGPLAEEVDGAISRLGLEKEVRRISRIPYDQMWKIYVMSDYFISLNRGEIFGMAIMEAVYYGVPAAACASAPGPSLILKEMEGHLLYAGDEELAAWLAGPAPSRQCLEESAARVVKSFSWDRCARTFVSILQRQQGGGENE